MIDTHPTAVWLDVARSSARSVATRRRLHRQFEFLDILGEPVVIGLTGVHSSAVARWQDWGKSRGYHVVTGRRTDLPTTALLLTTARRTLSGSARVATTPRRTARGLASWLEVQSVLVEVDHDAAVRVGNTFCHGNHRTALNYFESCLDTDRFVIGGNFGLVDPARRVNDSRRTIRDETRWLAAHTPFVEVPASSTRRRAGPATSDRHGHVFADATTARTIQLQMVDAADGDGPMSDLPLLFADEITAARRPAFDAPPSQRVTRRSAPPSRPSPHPRPCAK